MVNHHQQGQPARGLIALAIARPVGVTMIAIALIVLGFVGYARLPVQLLPDLSYPTVTIRTSWEGASPEDLDDRISEPIREAVSVLEKVVRTTTISRTGQSDVLIEFEWGTPMIHAVSDIREKLDRVFLPGDAGKPLILRYDPSLDPTLVFGLSGERRPAILREIAEDELEREIGEIEGVAAVKVKGGDEREVLIALDPIRLQALKLDVSTIAARIGAENLNSSAGLLEEGQTEYLVRALNEYRSLKEIGDLVLERRGTVNIYLKDVGDIRETIKEKDVITRIDGKPCVLIEVFKEADSNLVSLANRVKNRVLGTRGQQAKAKAFLERKKKKEAGFFAPNKKSPPKKSAVQAAEKRNKASKGKHGKGFRTKDLPPDYVAFRLPKDLHLKLLSDPSRYISNSISEVKSSALIGGLLAILVLFFFLRSFRTTVLIGIAIPVSLILTFAPLYLEGVSLNLMSLGGLALGIGMLVDTSIVVLESIQRCREEGDSLRDAALRGTREVANAVTASTLTTVAVFMPIVFVEGISGQLFKDQALAVVFSLLASLAVALFLLPVYAAKGSDHRKTETPIPQPTTRLGRWVQFLSLPFLRLAKLGIGLIVRVFQVLMALPLRAFVWGWIFVEKAYPPILKGALRLRVPILLGSLLLLFLSVKTASSLGSEVLPEVHQGEFEVQVFLPRDVDVTTTDHIVQPIEQSIAKLKGVARTFLTSGVGEDELRGSEEGRHSARLRVVLAANHDQAHEEIRVKDLCRKILDEEPKIQTYRFQNPSIFTFRQPIAVEVLGFNLLALRQASERVMERLQGIPNLSDIRSTLARGNTEVRIRFDREKLAQAGIDIATAAKGLAARVQGEVPTRFSERDKKIDIRVRLDPERIQGIQSLKNLNLSTQNGAPVLLSTVADLSLREGPSEVRRLGGRRGATVSGQVQGLAMSSVQRRVEEALADLELPPGIEVRMGSQKEEMEKSSNSMLGALLLAIFLVYVVMAAQFESLLQPLIILFTVPMAAIGVLFSLVLLDLPLSVVVFLGAIMLAGIVVNNAIVLIDRINQEREAGKETFEAILDGCRVRLRPVLMTTLTTILGLLPLTGWLPLQGLFGTSGEGTELRGPMAVTVITGLISATLLTLILVPIVYSFLPRKAPSPAPAEAESPLQKPGMEV
jgi:HAE1 family hydrophobic/amphiphilic exporter-1